MATIRYSIPGIGGSLGSCVVCGDAFVSEILLGSKIDSLRVGGIDADMPAHTKCAAKVIAMQGFWKDIREGFPEGPLKKVFDEQYEDPGPNPPTKEK